jgi:PAS domain S-box-containing protein
MKMTIFQKGLVLVALPLLVQLLFVGAVAFLQYRQSAAQRWTTHTKNVELQVQTLHPLLVERAADLRGYPLTNNPAYLAHYQRTDQQLQQSLTKLQTLVADNPQQAAQAQAIVQAMEKVTLWEKGVLDLLGIKRRQEAIELLSSVGGRERLEPVRRELALFLTTEEKLEAEREQQLQQIQGQLQYLLYVGVAVYSLGAVLLAFLFFGGISSRLTVLIANTRRLGQRQELLPPVTGTDEIAALDRTFRETAAELACSQETLEQSEERYRALVQASSQAVWSRGTGTAWDEDWKNWWEMSTGQQKNQLLEEEGWLQSLHPEDRALARQTWTKAQADHAPFQMEYRLRSPEGAYRYMDVRGVPLHRKDGKPAWVGTFTDITDRKVAQERLHKLNEELEQRVQARTAELAAANRELTQKNQENEMFVYSVSHDLRSPLVNLQGFSKELGLVCQDLKNLLAPPEVPAALREAGLKLLDGGISNSLRFIQNAVMRLSNIIDALLRLSRAGRITCTWQQVEMPTLLRRVTDALQATIQEKGASLQVADHLPSAWGDSTALEQIFTNLLSNALKYLDPQRPGRIEVGWKAGENKSHLYFVRDNGLGIPEAYLPKIFQAFQRLHPQAAPGEGMGLAIVQRLVERLGGKIWVESQVGQGSTFWVQLPAVAS